MKNLIIIMTFLLSPIFIFGQVTIKNINSDADTVFLGMCYLKDSLKTTFIITNNTNQSVKITPIDPSFYLGKPLGYPYEDFREFFRPAGSLPMYINAFDTKEITITYKADADLNLFPPGDKYALIKIGVYDANIPSEPPIEQMSAYKQVILKARKSNLFIDTYQDEIKLDSIFVLPNDTARRELRFRNNIDKIMNIESEGISYMNANTFPIEIKVNKNNNNSVFNTYGEQKSRSIRYYPIDRGWDTIIYSLNFKPDPINYPDSLKKVSTKITAFGIEQRLKLQDAINAVYSSDTIDAGEVRIGKTQQFKIIFQNRSNYPFGLTGQSILKIDSDINDDSFFFSKFLLQGGKHLPLDEYDTLAIDFVPTETKDYIARLYFESDITHRKFFGVPNSAKNIQFFLKAKGVLPKLSLPSDTVSFHNVIMSDNCPAIKDTIITLFNPGNEKILIERIEFSPELSNPFHINDTSFEIEPNSYYNFALSFHSEGLSINNEYQTRIIFHTNSEPPFDKVEALLTATTEPLLEMNLNIPKGIKSKTGRIVKIPIIVEKDKIHLSNKFTTNISFNKTILEYAGYDNLETASEATQQIYTSLIDENNLALNIISSPDNFIAKDTLIFLKFQTFLGDAVTTPIAFENPVFGNSNCDEVFILNNSDNRNGSLVIDSICGINNKILGLGSGKFSIKAVYPNPINDVATMIYQNPLFQDLKIELYSSSGDLIDTLLSDKIPAGEFSFEYNFKNLSSGYYIIKLSSSNNQKIHYVNICR